MYLLENLKPERNPLWVTLSRFAFISFWLSASYNWSWNPAKRKPAISQESRGCFLSSGSPERLPRCYAGKFLPCVGSHLNAVLFCLFIKDQFTADSAPIQFKSIKLDCNTVPFVSDHHITPVIKDIMIVASNQVRICMMLYVWCWKGRILIGRCVSQWGLLHKFICFNNST